MKLGRSGIAAAAGIIGLAVGFVIGWLLHLTDVPMSYRGTEAPLVEKAYRIYSDNGRMSRAEFEHEVTPVIVYLRDKTCVGLNLKPGWAGGDTTICFDEQGREVDHYVNGD